MSHPACAECGGPVEEARHCYAIPTCYRCLPSPPPLPINRLGRSEVALRPCPLTRDQANAFIIAKHRHHKRVTGHRYIVGAVRAGELVGIAVVGRPVAQMSEQYQEAEVTRLCTDGSKNVCSFLYSRCARVAQELGFVRLTTFILETESGASLKAAGWRFEELTRGGSWDRPLRHRKDNSPTCPKQRWIAPWSASHFAICEADYRLVPRGAARHYEAQS